MFVVRESFVSANGALSNDDFITKMELLKIAGKKNPSKKPEKGEALWLVL